MFSLQTMFGKGDRFYDLLEASSGAARDAARALHELVSNGDKAPYMAKFSAARKREKELAAQIGEELVITFVTPLEREDIEAMNSALYKIPKTVEKFAERYVLVADRLEGIDFTPRTELLVRCADVVVQMVAELRKGLRIDSMRKLQDRLQALESEADRMLLEPYSDFYASATDPIRAMLAKDLYEIIEKAVDKCRDVGNIIYSIVLKNS